MEFTDRKEEKIESFEAVRKAINEETEKVCGLNKNISPLPIKIKIYSPNVVDLLLVDLPGIVKVHLNPLRTPVKVNLRTSNSKSSV